MHPSDKAIVGTEAGGDDAAVRRREEEEGSTSDDARAARQPECGAHVWRGSNRQTDAP